MNRVLFNYLFNGYLKTIFKVILIIYCFGIIMNLFEEIEFFKNINSSLFLPVLLTLSYIPNLIFINLMPFAIFLSAMWFFISLRQNNDLLTLKVFGYSNFRIISIISAVAFFWGIIICYSKRYRC